jgi:hypothetical protein
MEREALALMHTDFQNENQHESDILKNYFMLKLEYISQQTKFESVN